MKTHAQKLAQIKRILKILNKRGENKEKYNKIYHELIKQKL